MLYPGKELIDMVDIIRKVYAVIRIMLVASYQAKGHLPHTQNETFMLFESFSMLKRSYQVTTSLRFVLYTDMHSIRNAAKYMAVVTK